MTKKTISKRQCTQPEGYLGTVAMPDGVIIESVRLGDGETQYATVDIDVSPVGIAQSVEFVIIGEDGDRFTVTWDAITGAAHIERGTVAAS